MVCRAFVANAWVFRAPFLVSLCELGRTPRTAWPAFLVARRRVGVFHGARVSDPACEPKGLSGKEQGRGWREHQVRPSEDREEDRQAGTPGTKGRAASSGYSARDITVLEGLEAVRLRPGMYIGSTGPRGLHHLVYEVVDNSVDEAIAGHCDHVSVTLHPDNSVTVADDGRGIPVEEHEKEKRPAAEVVMTTLHAGGKFGDGGGYKVSGGLHGVGVSVVNALSERLHLEVRRDGCKWTQDYVRGDPQGALKRGEKVKGTGTIITFQPDADVFEDVVLDYQTLSERLRETAFLTRNLRIDLDRRAGFRAERHLPVQGRDRRLRRPPEREQGRAAPEDRLLRDRDRRRPGRGGDAVELLLPGVRVQLRQQHQHPRGRRPSLGFPRGAHPHSERLRPSEGTAQGEGREPDRRRRPRGTDGCDLGEASGPAVRGSDEDQARQPAG